MAHEAKHGSGRRIMNADTLDALSGHGDPGKFGRMFPTLPPCAVSDEKLLQLAQAMRDPGAADKDNPGIPAGYTYFGQFVDHDITLDTTPLSSQDADPTATENFRTPALDLDSLYADGPGMRPDIYQRKPQSPYGPGNKFLIGITDPSPDQEIHGTFPNDLPRNRLGRALIGDERNDENLAVAQTHLALLKFHNAVVDHLGGVQDEDQFAEARRIVTWHYQWMVLFDWVERLTEPGLVRKIKHEGRRHYRFKKTPYMPAEFSGAAYRLGHSMVRQSYEWNRVFGTGPDAVTEATFDFIFGFTGKSGAIVGDLVDDPNVQPTPDIPGGKLRALPGNWIIDWRRFFDGLGGPGVNASRKLDPLLAQELFQLPGEAGNDAVLAFRNLKRGVLLGLPSGQSIAAHIGVDALAPGDFTGPDGDVATQLGLHTQTPLWYYILKEAEVVHGGARLGPVGSTIVAETFLGLVHGDHKSFLWLRSNWKPEIPAENPETFTLADMHRFTGDLNPIGD